MDFYDHDDTYCVMCCGYTEHYVYGKSVLLTKSNDAMAAAATGAAWGRAAPWNLRAHAFRLSAVLT